MKPVHERCRAPEGDVVWVVSSVTKTIRGVPYLLIYAFGACMSAGGGRGVVCISKERKELLKNFKSQDPIRYADSIWYVVIHLCLIDKKLKIPRKT